MPAVGRFRRCLDDDNSVQTRALSRSKFRRGKKMSKIFGGRLARLIPLWLGMYAGAACAFDPIKFDDGTVLDMSLQVGYVNMKRVKAPVLTKDYQVRPSSPSTGIVNPSFPLKGSLWSPAVESFTQFETQMNFDDGDSAVARHGTISNRVSALFDVNLSKDNYRAFVRVNTIRDESLFKSTANLSPATYNGAGPGDQYSETARLRIGQRTRLLDAYVQGRWKLGDNGQYPLFLKYGRQVVNWGEGLMFQGIGSFMNGNDQVKGQTPGTPAQEAFLPAEQIYGTLGINEKLTLMAYKKFQFQPTEFAPQGTYWSPDDGFTPGGAFLNAFPWRAWTPDVLKQAWQSTFGKPMPPGLYPYLLPPQSSYGMWRNPDIGRTSKGQWGLGAKYQWTDSTDIGLYHLRYTDPTGIPQMGFGTDWWKLGQGKVNQRSPDKADRMQALFLDTINQLTPFNDAYAWRYMNDIKLTGASFSTRIGDYSVAGETSYHSGVPIMLSNRHYAPAPARVVFGNINALLAMTGHEFLNGWTRAERVVVGGEITAQHLIGFDVPDYAVAAWQAHAARGPAEPVFDRNAVATVLRLELGYTPFPEWELSIPMFYWKEFVGNGAVQGGWNAGLLGKNSGRVTVETRFIYKQNLELGLSYAHFLGDIDTRWHTFNEFADRDFVAFNAGYHF